MYNDEDHVFNFPSGVEDIWEAWPEILTQPDRLSVLLDNACFREEGNTFPEEMKDLSEKLIPLLETIVEN